MTGRLALALLVVAVLPAAAQRRTPEKRCVAEILRSDRQFNRFEPTPGQESIYIGGNVKMRCVGQNVFWGADSVESINNGNYFRLLGKAYFRDGTLDVVADTLNYDRLNERLAARKDVVVKDARNGSTLTGVWVDYIRPIAGRQTEETIAYQRPTLRFFPRAGGRDSSRTPYLIVGDVIKGIGSDEMRAIGNATVERDSLRGRGDSLVYRSGTGAGATLFGRLAELRRTGADSLTARGQRVVLDVRGEVLAGLRALGEGDVTSGASAIRGDTVLMAFEQEKLALTTAWGRSTPATVRRDGYDVAGDSIVIETPGEKLRAVRVFGRGELKQPVDSAVPASARDRNTMWGDRVVAEFAQVDSAGVQVTRVQRIEARGKGADRARALYTRQVTARDGTSNPTTNYSRADLITVTMKRDSTGIDDVRMKGNVDGVQLERASLRARRDSAATLPPGRRP